MIHVSTTHSQQRAVVARAMALTCLVALALLGIPKAAGAAPATHTVVMQATSFAPQQLTVRRGDTVIWVNKDPFPHTATAAGVFDSGSIAADGSWHYKANGPGEYHYVCTLHPNMKATLRVR